MGDTKDAAGAKSVATGEVLGGHQCPVPPATCSGCGMGFGVWVSPSRGRGVAVSPSSKGMLPGRAEGQNCRIPLPWVLAAAPCPPRNPRTPKPAV